MDLTSMDYIRAALANAMAEGLDLASVYMMAQYAETPEDFDAAVNMLINAGAARPPGAVWTPWGWEEIR